VSGKSHNEIKSLLFAVRYLMQITKKRRIVRIRSHEQVRSHCTLLGRMRDVVRRICLERPGCRNGLFFLGGPPRPVCGSDRTALAARTKWGQSGRLPAMIPVLT